MNKNVIEQYVGNNIAKIRKNRGISLKDLAEELGVSRQQVRNYEIGETRLSLETLIQFSNILNVQIEEFFEEHSGYQSIGNEVDGGKKSIRILVIEDSVTDSHLTRNAIQETQLDVEVMFASNGEEAFDTLNQLDARTLAPQLILLDLNLPKMSGIEILKKLKSIQQYKRTPVVVLTHSSDDKDIETIYYHGASGYVVKSFSPKEFYKKISLVLTYWSEMSLPLS